MKRHAVIIAIHTKHSGLEIYQFFNLMATWKVLPSAENINLVYTQLEHHSLCTKSRTLIIEEDPSKSIRAISRDLQVSECTIRRIVHEDIWYKSYVMHSGQFMSAQTLLLHIKP